MTFMRILLIGAVAASLTACGGGSSSSSSDPSSKSYDPAETTLKDAGLQTCSEAQKDLPPTLTTIQGVGATRSFYVAADCKGLLVTANTVTAFQFTNKDDIATGEAAIKVALPKGAVTQHYPLVIAATGPNAQANLDAVVAQLPPLATS